MVKTLPMHHDVRDHIILNSVLALLALLALILRLWARRLKAPKFGVDDWLMILSIPIVVGSLIEQGIFASWGVGYHMVQLPPENIVPIVKMVIPFQLTYCWALALIKLSILAWYRRVFVNRGVQIATKACIAFVSLWLVANTLQIFLICRPLEKLWNPLVPGHCGNQKVGYVAIGVFNLVTDVVILLLPISTVWKLPVRTASKIGLTFVFTLGLLVSAITIARIVFLTRVDLQDYTGTVKVVVVLTVTEPLLALVCVNLPLAYPLFALVAPKVFGTVRSKSAATAFTDASNSRNSRQILDRWAPRSKNVAAHEEHDLGSLYNADRAGKDQATIERSLYATTPSLNGSETGLNLHSKEQAAPKSFIQKQRNI